MIRKIVKRIVRNKVIKRYMPEEFGAIPFYITSESQLRYRKLNKYEAFGKELLNIVKQYVAKDSFVWDIGVNVGVFTFVLVGIIKNGNGEVVVVEADMSLANLLNRSKLLDSNKNINIKILPIAVFSQIGINKFEIASRGRALNNLASSNFINRDSKGGLDI